MTQRRRAIELRDRILLDLHDLGMSVADVVSLHPEQICWTARAVTVPVSDRAGTREVGETRRVLDPTTARRMEEYRLVRRALRPRCGRFFVSDRGGQLSIVRVHEIHRERRQADEEGR
ncbi:MAG: hypothetical protein AAGC60_00120 [Acidobacteriota bacterium]